MSVFGGLWEIVTSLSIVSQVFILAIAGLWLMFNFRYNARVVELGPTILTTLGIFGTFLGVALGLSHFDTGNVQASVPSLLAGLKTAFWASVFGVGAAVQLKMREFLVDAFTTKKKAGGQSLSPLAVLVDIREALAGYGDASLPQQIRLMRQDMGDRLVGEIAGNRRENAEKLDALRRGQAEALAQSELAGQVQQKALHQLAGGATDSLVAALQAVVTDFNHKVAGQFGENYRELGDAVRQLLTWQEEYRETIRATNLQLGDTLRQLGYAAGDFRTVTTGSERFAQTAERVARIMDAIEAGEERLMVLARSMAEVTGEASGRIPFIEAHIAALTSQMTRAVQDNQSALHTALAGSADQMQQTVRSIASGLSGAAQAGATDIRDNQRAIALALQDNASAMTGALAATQSELTAAMARFEAQMTTMIAAAGQRILDWDGGAVAGQPHARPRPMLHVVGEAVALAEE